MELRNQGLDNSLVTVTGGVFPISMFYVFFCCIVYCAARDRVYCEDSGGIWALWGVSVSFNLMVVEIVAVCPSAHMYIPLWKK